MKAKLNGTKLNGLKWYKISSLFKAVVHYFCKKTHPDQVPTTCYETVVRKFPMYKLKQKKAKKNF